MPKQSKKKVAKKEVPCTPTDCDCVEEIANKIVDSVSDKLEKRVQQIVNQRLDNGLKKFVEKVDEGIHFRYNSFNIFVGNQGSSKTTTVMKELMKLGYVEHDFHLLIYVTNNESDDTFNNLSEYLDIQILRTNYDDVEEQFEQLISLKDEYNAMVDGEIDQDPAILEELYVEDFSRRRLHTLILFDDASFVFDKKSKSKFKSWLCQCRHLNITVFCILQIWGSLDPKLKSQLSSCYIFKGFGRERVQYIYRQLPIEIKFEEFWHQYMKLQKYQKLIVDCVDNTITIQ